MPRPNIDIGEKGVEKSDLETPTEDVEDVKEGKKNLFENSNVMVCVLILPEIEKQPGIAEEFLSNSYFKKFNPVFYDISNNEEFTKPLKSEGYEVKRLREEGEDLSRDLHVKVRSQMKEDFLEREETHLFFLKGTVLPPFDTMVKLLVMDKPIATGVFLGVQDFNGKKLLSPNLRGLSEEQEGAATRVPVKQVVPSRVGEVYGCELGCSLVKREVLEEVEFKKHSLRLGEDYIFCKEAREKGFRTYADSSVKAYQFMKGGYYKVPRSMKEYDDIDQEDLDYVF